MPIYAHAWLTVTLGSMIVAACVVSEVYYLVSSLWRRQYYFMYLYLAITGIVMGYVALTVSIVQTFAALSAGKYRWWWRSFLVGFGAGVHIFAICA